MTTIPVRTEVADDSSSWIVVGPWPADRRHDLLSFSASLFNDGVPHAVDPVELNIRVPVGGLSFESMRAAVARCLELQPR